MSLSKLLDASRKKGFDSGIIREQLVDNKKYIDTLTGMYKKGEAWVTTSTRAASGMKVFRMELLSVMFFGMAIQKSMEGLLKPSMDAVGIFDIWGTTLKILFLPAAFLVLGFVLSLQQFLLGLPEPVQGVISGFALLLLGLGTALFIFGQVGLGISGLGMLFPSLGTAVAAAGGGIVGAFKVIGAGAWSFLMSPVGMVIAAIVIILIALYLAWQGNWFGIREVFAQVWGYLEPVFGFLGVVMEGVGKIAMLVFNGIAAVVVIAWNIIKIPLDLLWGILSSFMDALFPGFKGQWGDLWTFLSAVLRATWNAIEPILGFLGDKLNWILGILKWLAQVAGEVGRAIGGAVGGFIGRIIDVVGAVGGIFGLAEGGIVTRPTIAMIGEAGPEAVIPLGRGGGGGGGNYYTTINISATLKDEVDIDMLKRRIGEDLARETFSKLRR